MNIWVVIHRVAVAVMVAAAAVVGVSLFIPRVHSYRELQRRKQALESEIRAEERAIAQLKWQQERLRSNPRYVERIAREELNLARPGETVFRFADTEAETDDGR